MDLDNHGKPFVWRKKYEELGVKVDEKEIEAESRRRIEENKVELAKIKERQRLRELEYQQKLNDGQFLQRQKEAEEHENWISQEDDFLLRQHRHRSRIRIRDGRAKPIDLLAHYVEIYGAKTESTETGYLLEEKIDISDSSVELVNPCYWFNGLRQSDLESLELDIKIYMSADSDLNQQYWKDLLEITRNEIFKLQAVTDKKKTDINTTVLTDVMSLFEGKSIEELDDMEEEMSNILDGDDPSVDVAFYQGAINRLRAHRAKMRLTSNHEKNLELQKDTLLPKEPAQEEKQPEEEEEEVKVEDVDTKTDCIEDYKQGSYSPKMYRKSQLPSGIVLVDYEKEYDLLTRQRNQVCSGATLDDIKLTTMTTEERAFVDAASKGMNSQEESMFSCEAEVKGQNNRPHTYAWADKYQPRKPRYFNRVHTGFEWNKYNQTHYDIDNPPPKVVQGYKFNIFYPDLIDSSKAPTFTLTPCKDDKDFCIIRFSAGPPYEDIAFRIVNREWNNSHKSGYRCQFMNNMLQLWFQFKRYRYRR